jgi:hypothetical protein
MFIVNLTLYKLTKCKQARGLCSEVSSAPCTPCPPFKGGVPCTKINRSALIAGILAAMSLLSGVIPKITFSSNRFLNWDNIAYAQEYTSEEIYNYAKAGFEQEMLRQQVYQEIKSMVNQPPPDITCDQPNTMNNIPTNIRGIVNNYCNRSRQIVGDNNLSIQRFNQLKIYYDRGGSFYQQVQQQLLNLQK